MDLTDAMSAANLKTFAEVALVLFFVAFVAVVLRTLRRPRAEMEEQARIVLDDGDASETVKAGTESGRRQEG